MRRYHVGAALLLCCAALLADDNFPTAVVIHGDTERVPAQTIAPEYPRKARRDRIEGEVQVCFDVNRLGRTRRIAVRHSSHRIFEKPSIRAIRQSTFKPLADDEPLQVMKACRTFVFALEPVAESGDV